MVKKTNDLGLISKYRGELMGGGNSAGIDISCLSVYLRPRFTKDYHWNRENRSRYFSYLISGWIVFLYKKETQVNFFL